jgi:hypothetical protein
MKKVLPFIIFSVLLIACGLSPIETAPAATSTPTLEPLPPITPTAVPCRFEASRTYAIYRFPSTSAPVFSNFSAGDDVYPTHRTANGFYGFDPGVAQAGNVGVFRLRWFLKTSYMPSSGDCDRLPLVQGPMAEICYVVLNADTPLYASDSLTATVVGNLDEGDTVMQLSSGSSWVHVDLNVGSEQLDLVGWVPRDLVIYQGACMGP